MGQCIVADLATPPHPAQARHVVLIVEDDADIANLLVDLLTDEGYAVALLRPDCVLVDGAVPGSYGGSWADAAWMRAQEAAIPVIMFSADRGATTEAISNLSERSRAAGFAAVLPKPFEIDDLLRVIAGAVSQSPFRSGA